MKNEEDLVVDVVEDLDKMEHPPPRVALRDPKATRCVRWGQRGVSKWQKSVLKWIHGAPRGRNHRKLFKAKLYEPHQTRAHRQ
jgi:hypothetical protein